MKRWEKKEKSEVIGSCVTCKCERREMPYCHTRTRTVDVCCKGKKEEGQINEEFGTKLKLIKEEKTSIFLGGFVGTIAVYS